MTTTILKIADIRQDGGTQVRAEKDPGTVRDYAAAIVEGVEFPPVVVFDDGQSLWLSDGFHRVEAAIEAGREEIAAEVRRGTLRDALVCALSSNGVHGLRLSNADKRRAVGLALDDEQLSQWSDREIARWVGVTQPFVSKLRGERLPTVGTPEVITVITPEVVTVTTPEEGGVLTVNTWGPKDGCCSTAQTLGWCAIVMASDYPGYFYVTVLHPKDHQPNLEGMTKPLRADAVPRILRTMGFPLDEAAWTTLPVGSDPDSDEGLDLENRWTWPHLLFESRREWMEKRWAPEKESPLLHTDA